MVSIWEATWEAVRHICSTCWCGWEYSIKILHFLETEDADWDLFLSEAQVCLLLLLLSCDNWKSGIYLVFIGIFPMASWKHNVTIAHYPCFPYKQLELIAGKCWCSYFSSKPAEPCECWKHSLVCKLTTPTQARSSQALSVCERRHLSVRRSSNYDSKCHSFAMLAVLHLVCENWSPSWSDTPWKRLGR